MSGEKSPERRYTQQTPIRSEMNFGIAQSQSNPGTTSNRMPQPSLHGSREQSSPVTEDKYMPQSYQKTIFEGRSGLSRLERNHRLHSIQVDRPGLHRSISGQRLYSKPPRVIIENSNVSVHSSPPSLAVSSDPILFEGATPDTSPGRDSAVQPSTMRPISSRRNSLVLRTSSEGSLRVGREERRVNQSRERTSYHLQRDQRDLDYTFYGPIFGKR